MSIGFLLSEPNYVSCRRLGEVMNISHVRGKRATQNHWFAAIFGFVQLQQLTIIQAIND
jgi:hypothetical protein